MKQKKITSISSRSDVQFVLKNLNGLIRVKAGRGWVKWLLKVAYTLRGGMTSAVARSSVVCIDHFYSVYKRQGVKGLVLRTKSLYILTMQAVGGRQAPPQALGPAVARASDGLPRIIPREHRRRIRNGDVFILRLWLSWFSIYRVLTFPGRLKLNTITDPGVVMSDSLIREMLTFMRPFCDTFLGVREGEMLKRLRPPTFFTLSKSTPVLVGKGRKVSSSPEGIIEAAYALKNSDVWHSFKYLMELMCPPKDPSELTDRDIMYTRQFAGEGPGGVHWFPKVLEEIFLHRIQKSEPRNIGKLGFKNEAAGKVRVFAMVDCWTQWLLYPVHQFLFDLLRGIPMDGTHDQIAPIERLIERGNYRFWCYDLSAATDRLPVFIQAHILNFLCGKSFGYAWQNLLVGRRYAVPLPPKGVEAKKLPSHVSYAVGQPMGALSSWAMLAITHHFIVQWAAARINIPDCSFEEYAVLGDDVVICEGRVAGAYLQLMKSMGVGIGIHKSLVSRKGVLEFAKRFYVKTVDCSPVPFAELVAAIRDFESCANFILKYKLGLRSIAAVGGWGYRVRGRLSAFWHHLPKKLSSILIWRVSPWGSHPHNLSSWFNIKGPIIRPEWLVQATEMWPSLADPFASALKHLVSKSEAKCDKLSQMGYRGDFKSTRKAVRMMFDWFDDGLYSVAKKIGPHYNALYWIQGKIWQTSIPPLNKDIVKLKDVSMAVRHANIPLDESKFMKWVDVYNSMPQIKDLDKLGMIRRSRSTPGPLWMTRLHRMSSSGTTLHPPSRPTATVKSKVRPRRRDAPVIFL